MFGWIFEFERRAQAAGDRDRLRLVQLKDEAYAFRETDPDRALALFDEGRRLAERLAEPWWVLYYRRWHAHALMHFKRDYRSVLELAVANTLEARKPKYDGFPQRISIYADLVSAYTGIDPEGHAAAIIEALDSIEAEMPPSLECRLHLWGLRREFALQRRRWDEAEAAAQRSLEIIARKPDTATARHYLVSVYSGLCAVHFGRGEWDRLEEAASRGEAVAREVVGGHSLEWSECVLWGAVWARRDFPEPDWFAPILHEQAVAVILRLGTTPASSWFDALCAFHELGGELEAALEARDRELQAIAHQGRLACECRCRVQRCRLLARLGRLTAEDLQAAGTAARRLRDPALYLAELELLAGGGGEPSPARDCIRPPARS
jgi:hypothetical protein